MPGRNDPCPCGSGQKYKKCHLAADEASRLANAAADAPSPLHDLDDHLIERILRFAESTLRVDLNAMFDDWFDEDASPQFAIPWLCYSVPLKGKTLGEYYLARRRDDLSSLEIQWIEGQSRSWLTVWEVVAVDPGRGMSLLDLLTGQRRDVHERSASKSVRVRHGILGRVVDCAGESLLVGVHPRPFPPNEAAAVLQSFRRHFKTGSKPMNVKTLRNFDMAAALFDLWHEEEEAMVERLRIGPTLQNTDGDPLLMTSERFRFDRARRAEILDRLGAMDDLHRDDEGEFTALRKGNRQHRSWESTVVAHLTVGDGRLTVETNSIARADAMKRTIESALAGLVTWEARSHVDPRSTALAGEPRPAPERTEEILAIIRQEKETHYLSWVDEPLPALGGRTPKEALKTRAGRERVLLLLKELEFHESLFPAEERFDMRRLYEMLGVGPPS